MEELRDRFIELENHTHSKNVTANDIRFEVCNVYARTYTLSQMLINCKKMPLKMNDLIDFYSIDAKTNNLINNLIEYMNEHLDGNVSDDIFMKLEMCI